MSAENPASIGPYTVIARLDQGGDVAVYKVKDGAGRTLAVKLYGDGEGDDLREFRRHALDKATSLPR